MKHFNDFNLKDTTYQFIRALGFKNPTPIQEAVIPVALKGKDVIGISKTGTGKTHAYLIPLMEKIDSSSDQIQAIITAPTRELAVQIYEKAQCMKDIDPELRISLYTGGSDREHDIEKLQSKQPHIAIGTPGRLKDLFLQESVLRIDKAEILIIDEADMTLEYGFLDDIDAFAGRMPENLQMLLFSATIPDQLKPFLKKYMHHPITFEIEEKERFNPDIRHILVPCYHHTYEETVLTILPFIQPYVCIIFANTRTEAEELASVLREHHYPVTELHGNLESRKRKQAMREFSNNEKTYVVATDLAARGIDNDAVTHVISCGFPEDLSFYTHRAGRTGRAGGTGTCFALYHESDDSSIRSLMKSGIHFDHARFRKDGMQNLKPYGIKHKKKDDDMAKKISMMMTKKNSKVKPGYKKKRAAAIEKLQKEKRRDFIREKIREEKVARYKQRSRDKRKSESNQ